jgi:pre-rRNA-processing protein IPI3
MLHEDFFSSVCGPPIAANTAVSKDVGIYAHSLSPLYAVKSTFKKSSTLPNCLAVSDTHVFAAQNEKAHVHVYSRIRGNQEALVPFPEQIRSLALLDDVLVLGTAEGRLILWEVNTFPGLPPLRSQHCHRLRFLRKSSRLASSGGHC